MPQAPASDQAIDHAAPERADRDPAPAVSRALRILTLLADADGVPLTLSDIARALGLAKSSTANLCISLEEGGMIEREPSGFRLGRRTAELGGAFAMQFNQVREFYRLAAASPQLHREVVQLAMLDGAHALYLARHEGRSPYRLGTPLGSRLPAALSATGMALLARLDDDEALDHVRRIGLARCTDHTLVTESDLLADLALIRERGYALDEQEQEVGVRCVAVAVGEPMPWLAVSVSGPVTRMTDEIVDRAVPLLQAAARRLTR